MAPPIDLLGVNEVRIGHGRRRGGMSLTLPVADTVADSGINPPDQANLEAWYDADSAYITLNGGNVSQWDDRSGNANHLTQGVAVSQPLYQSSDANFNNHPSLFFDGSNDYLLSGTFANSSLAQPNTIYIVYRFVTTGGSDNYLYDGILSTNRHAFFEESSDGKYDLFAGSLKSPNLTVDTNVHISVIVWNVASTEMYEDGGSDFAPGGGSHTLTGISIASNWGPGGYPNVEVTEMLIYSNAQNDANKNDLGNQLATKYGTVWSDIS